MIRLDRVTKRYPDGTVAVAELSIDVPRGALVVLVGPSGCGKTTTMKMVNRLIEPTSGRIFLDGVDVTNTDPVKLRRFASFVNAPTTADPSLAYVAERGQVRPATSAERADPAVLVAGTTLAVRS